MPVRGKLQARAPLGCMALFFGVFALVGGSLLWFLGFRPLLKAYEARSWVEAPAEIVTSEVERHSGSKGGSTYNVAIAFDYTYQDRRYRGIHYDFETGSSSGIETKQAVVDRFRPGTRTTAWVNPTNPNEAVIDRNLGWWFLWGLFPLPFLAAGLGGLLFIFVAARGARKEVVLRGDTPRALGPS